MVANSTLSRPLRGSTARVIDDQPVESKATKPIIEEKTWYRSEKNGREIMVYVESVKGNRIVTKRAPEAKDSVTETPESFAKKRFLKVI